MGKVTKGGIVHWRGGGQPYETVLPSGLRVKPAPMGPTEKAQTYFLEDLSVFKDQPFELHDATHYGLRLNEEQVKDG